MSGVVLVIPIFLPLTAGLVALEIRGRPMAWLATGVLALQTLVELAVLRATLSGDPIVYRVGGWPPPVGIALVADPLSALLGVSVGILATASTLHTALERADVVENRFFHSIFLILVAALNAALVTGDLFNLYVFFELVILSSFALVAMANQPISPEATFKYAILSALGSLFLLAGAALVYGALGTLTMAEIALRSPGTGGPGQLQAAFGLIFAAFLLKTAIFPFHFWQPDAHSAAPTSVSAMLSGVLVKLGAYGLIRLSTLIFPTPDFHTAILALGVGSALFGALAALATPHLKRLLAYSTISNMGFILVGIGLATVGGLAAAIVFAVSHALVKGALFLTAGHSTDRIHEYRLARLRGLAALTPIGALAFGLGGLALAGIPPTSGFVGKLLLFHASLSAGQYLVAASLLAASLLALGYSLRAFVVVYWGPPALQVADAIRRAERVPLPVAPLLLLSSALLLGIWPDLLVGPALIAASALADPRRYIHAVMGGIP